MANKYYMISAEHRPGKLATVSNTILAQDHKQAIRKFIDQAHLVRLGEWHIDPYGSVWTDEWHIAVVAIRNPLRHQWIPLSEETQ